MQVAAKVTQSAKTELSQDGNVLVVHRFDVDENGKPFRALEDFCALLGLRPQNKYETTWERIAKAVRDHVDGSYQYETFQKLSSMLLMTFALRNADCHSKNLALLYTSRKDARLAPVYDFFTTSVYAGLQRQSTRHHVRRQEDVVAGEDSREVHHCYLRHSRPRAEADGRENQ